MKEITVKIDEKLCDMLEDRHYRAEAAQNSLNRILSKGTNIPEDVLKAFYTTCVEIEAEKMQIMDEIETVYGPEDRISFTVIFKEKIAVFVVEE